MADQQIRDRHNKLLGTIKTRSDGKLEIRDSHNQMLGIYDPKKNETRDSHNSLVAKGNVLSSFLS